MAKRLIPIADTHSGLKVGLMPPKVVDFDGAVFMQSPSQKYIWKLWQKTFKKITKKVGDTTNILLLMGDAIHGPRRPEETYSASLKVQKDAYIECVLPYAHKAEAIYAVKGTKWHVGEDGIIEHGIAQELGAWGKKAYDKLELEVEGVKFMLQHKGPAAGSRAWTEGNAMRLFLRSKTLECLKEGREPCDVYLWAHFHTYKHVMEVAEGPWGEKIIHGFILPSWCAANEYALTVVKNLELSDIGLVYFDVEDGQFTWHKEFERFDNVTRVKHS